MAEGAILIATESAMFDYEGKRVVITAGRTTAREGHPVLKGREQLFGPLQVNFELPGQVPAPPKAAPRTRAAKDA